MSIGQSKKRSFGRIVYRAFCILLVLTALTAWSVSGVYAKYVTSNDANGSANIASMGITVFELIERGKAADRVDIDFEKVVPGFDIPGPHIKLKINSEVSYTLYVRVTQTNPLPTYTYTDESGNPVTEDTVSYAMSAHWQPEGEPVKDGDKIISTYKYNNVADPTIEEDFVFKAGTPYDDNDDPLTIELLKDDVIYVYEHYQHDSANFKLTFEAYIQQVL